MVCPEGFQHSENASLCTRPCGMITKKGEHSCNLANRPSCHCPEGQHLEENQCIPKEECPCFFNRQKYKSQAVVKMKCNEW